MTKIILLALIVSLPSFAQNADELTLESTTAPTVVEDGSDLVEAPAEAPAETPAATPAIPDISTTNVNPEKDVPAVIPDSTESVESPKAAEANEPTEAIEPTESSEISEAKDITEPTESTEMTSDLSDEPKGEQPLEITSAPEEVQTPNPLESTSKKPEDSTPLLSTKMPYDSRRINHYKSHWVTTFGFEGTKYNLPFPEFDGNEKDLGERDQELWGARFGFGGQIHLGAGFFTTSTLEIFYVGTLFTKTQEAGSQVPGQEVGSIKRSSGFYGGDVSQKLGYIFEWRTKNPFMDEWSNLTFEPFIEAGLGMGQSYNKVHYQYDSGVTDEKYKAYLEDNILYAKAGGGFNITGGNGFFMQARVMINTYDITERQTRSYIRRNNGTVSIQRPEKDKDAKMDPQTVFTLGGGYKF